MGQSEHEANACNRRQAREKACERGTVGFSFACHWLRNWREFYKPITEPTKVEPEQTRNYFRHRLSIRRVQI